MDAANNVILQSGLSAPEKRELLNALTQGRVNPLAVTVIGPTEDTDSVLRSLISAPLATRDDFEKMAAAIFKIEAKMDEHTIQDLSFSAISTAQWDTIKSEARIKVAKGELALPNPVPNSNVQRFPWGNGTEVSQHNEYMTYLQRNFPCPPSSKLGWIDGQSHKGLLKVDMSAHQPAANFRFKGNADAAVVDTDAMVGVGANRGLRLVLELKKDIKGSTSYPIQAQAQLYAAEMLSLYPVCLVLTDLGLDFNFYWMEGLTLHFWIAPSKKAAHWALKWLLAKEFVPTPPPEHVPIISYRKISPDDVSTAFGSSGGRSDVVQSLMGLLDGQDDWNEQAEIRQTIISHLFDPLLTQGAYSLDQDLSYIS